MSTQDDFSELKKIFQLKDYDILSIFPYGSRVYGTFSDKSDYDYIAVFRDGTVKDEFALEKGKFNIHTYNESSFVKLIEKHKIFALECISLPEEFNICNRKKFNFKLNIQTLRSSISEKSSHSFRIIDFGKQIAKDGKIGNYSSMNDLWFDILNNSSEDWKDYFELYKTKHNEMLSEFRKLAPK